ncbi:MAG: alpha-hydroxy-acid oxidizing protein [Acidobacteria bacterium]|nr:alpha-hydroxy-acid oxidizing protein [Acidobacteriota bacterium]
MTADDRWLRSPERRDALRRLAAYVAASPLFGVGLGAQLDPRPIAEHRRLPGLDELQTAFDFEPLMFANVPQQVYDYTAHGDGSEFTLQRNRRAFEWVDLVPRPPVDPPRVDFTTTLFGTTLPFPLLVAPTAFQVPVHPDGEVGMRRAAAAANTLFILSQNSSVPVEKVAAAVPGGFWCQFYPQQDRDIGKEWLARFQAAGATAIVVTVDQQASWYERTQRDRNLGGSPRPAPRPAPSGAPPRGAARYRVNPVRLWYSWPYLEEIRPLIEVPLVVKGIMNADDARLAFDHGADAIVVSNHGGRSMDYGPSALEVLPEIVSAVGRRGPVLTDSGYRRGADVLKALALGADAVLLGRVTRWGLGAFGAAGAERVLRLVQRELTAAAAHAGCRTRADIDSKLVRTRFL